MFFLPGVNMDGSSISNVILCTTLNRHRSAASVRFRPSASRPNLVGLWRVAGRAQLPAPPEGLAMGTAAGMRRTLRSLRDEVEGRGPESCPGG